MIVFFRDLIVATPLMYLRNATAFPKRSFIAMKMRSFIFYWIIMLLTFEIRKSGQMYSSYAANDSRFQGSCMVNTGSFNRSCIYNKIAFLFEKLPLVSSWTMTHMGPLEFIRLPDYATSIVHVTEALPTSRSFSNNVISMASKTIEYFLDSYGIKIPLPPLSKSFPGIIVEDMSNNTQWDEGRGKKKDQKRFAMVFPLIATFKFILIKALLIPILMGILAIKKMLVVAAMAVPTIIAMLRICRFGPFGGGGGVLGPAGFTAAAAAAPLMTAPYVASDTIIGDFSNYAPAAMSAHQPYYNNKQQDYGGKSFPSLNQYNSGSY